MVVVVVAEEEMETEEDEADSKRHHVVHSINGAVCRACKLRRFFLHEGKPHCITRQPTTFIYTSYPVL